MINLTREECVSFLLEQAELAEDAGEEWESEALRICAEKIKTWIAV